MILSVGKMKPDVAENAFVSPAAVVRGDVRIGDGSVVLAGAVITAEGGSVQIGVDCVVMEHAVLRGVPRHSLFLGDRVLVGPHAHLSGCRVDTGCFVATGAAVFNGAHLQRDAEVRVNGVVHVNTRLPASSTVPIGWVAVGDPAAIMPATDHEGIWAIQKELDFPGTVFMVDRDVPQGERTRRYARSLRRQKKDEVVEP